MREKIYNKVYGDSVLILLFFSICFLPLSVHAQNYIQTLENGSIDWSNGVIEATGIGQPPKQPINPAHARAKAEYDAIFEARSRLLALILGIQVDSVHQVKDLIRDSESVLQKIKHYLQYSRVVDISYPSDGSVKARVSLMLTSAFADLVLPSTIRVIQPIKQKTVSETHNGDYTGFIIDCSGLKVKPSMIPKIIDEEGHEVYGPVNVSRNYAIHRTLTGYIKGIRAAEKDPKVAHKPLIIKGVGPAKTGPSDIIISNADAEKVRGDAHNLLLLQKCKIIIVLD